MLTDKQAANEFAQLYRRESTLPLIPKKVGDMKEKLKQEEKQENIPIPCLNSTRKTSELNSVIDWGVKGVRLGVEKRTTVETVEAGVSGQMYRWISSFFYHRMARVKLDGSPTIEIRLKEGVPQGSVLSPSVCK